MLDIKFIRENPEVVEQGLRAKNTPCDLSELLDLDKERRALLSEVEKLKSERNQANDQIAQLRKDGQKEQADGIISQMKAISQKIKEIDALVGGLSEKIDTITHIIPNLPHADAGVGPGNSANKVVKRWGEPRKFAFKAKDHVEIGENLGWLSMEKGSKITGSAFPVYEGGGARLQRALINFMMELHTEKHGYKEIWPPALVNRLSMTGTGQLPKFEEEMYKLKDDDYFLIPTAEVPITNLHRDEIFKEEDLPRQYVAYSPCFRREAGSYGKDTRGLSRVHQFDKIELVQFVKPENGLAALETLRSHAETVLQLLELPYRVVLLGTGDMSFAAAKCYDLEVWAPASEKWFEVSSCSWFGDFQARRIHARYRNPETKKPEYVHTLNGSGVALARTVLCLLENYQDKQGKFVIPKALETYLGKIE